MRISLPDVNVLIAAAWPSHIHHRYARRWFVECAPAGWATCPFTQCGFVRISSNPKIIADAVSPREALRLLGRISAIGSHEFWPDDLDLTTDAAIPSDLLMGHRQVTDAYLLGLALKRAGKLVTLDRSIGELLPTRSRDKGAIEIVPTQ